MLKQVVQAMESMDKIMKPLIGISMEQFDALQAESKVQLRKSPSVVEMGLF